MPPRRAIMSRHIIVMYATKHIIFMARKMKLKFGCGLPRLTTYASAALDDTRPLR